MKWWRRIKQFWWDYSSDLGEFMAVFLMVAIGIVACAFFWILVVEVLQALKHWKGL